MARKRTPFDHLNKSIEAIQARVESARQEYRSAGEPNDCGRAGRQYAGQSHRSDGENISTTRILRAEAPARH